MKKLKIKKCKDGSVIVIIKGLGFINIQRSDDDLGTIIDVYADDPENPKEPVFIDQSMVVWDEDIISYIDGINDQTH